ncbi:MAG: TRAP transporter large permease subunit, partial [Gemmobacter sp.]|nr:TRAP transporter large permease subunit [Gemmobacter sp.]
MAADIVLYMIGLLFLLVLLGFHIAVVLATTSAIGLWIMFGDFNIAISLLSSASYDAIRSQVFIVIPLFVLMGDLVSKSGAAGDLYRTC